MSELDSGVLENIRMQQKKKIWEIKDVKEKKGYLEVRNKVEYYIYIQI